MRKLLLIFALLPYAALAYPPFHGESPCADLPPPPNHHRPFNGEDDLPGFLDRDSLSEKQQADIKSLLKANRAEFDEKIVNVKKLDVEIHRLSLSNDYSEEKIQTLIQKAGAIHREIELKKAKLDNTIYQLLSNDQKQKLQNKAGDGKDCRLL